MSENERKLSTNSYKGVRDFYPEDMAIQEYIFDTWSEVAESFGFEKYDASVLEPAELYKSKTSEEIVNEQTYTFTDRGDREVTLRPEMTPTVARMVAGKKRELTFPLRWYSIPNLFRYERQQRGRLREHWQLNCDIFGSTSPHADAEIITLGAELLKAFGATDADFEIRLSNRSWLQSELKNAGVKEEKIPDMIRLIDRKDKIDTFEKDSKKIAGSSVDVDSFDPQNSPELSAVIKELASLGITNVKLSPSTVRGFDYYTGTVFEFFDTDPKNNRSLLGGGRYDNLTGLFGGDPIPGIGFGFGDVTMRDFLESHDLPLTDSRKKPVVALVTPSNESLTDAYKIAKQLREAGKHALVDISEKRIGDQIARADKREIPYILTVGEDEVASNVFSLKRLSDGFESRGSIKELIGHIS